MFHFWLIFSWKFKLFCNWNHFASLPISSYDPFRWFFHHSIGDTTIRTLVNQGFLWVTLSLTLCLQKYQWTIVNTEMTTKYNFRHFTANKNQTDPGDYISFLGLNLTEYELCLVKWFHILIKGLCFCKLANQKIWELNWTTRLLYSSIVWWVFSDRSLVTAKTKWAC